MSQKTKVVLNRAGVGALLNSDEVAACVTESARGVQQKAGPDYEVAAPHKTGQRVAVNVYPGSEEAARDNYENNTLLRAIS